jgi:hypothetical protein
MLTQAAAVLQDPEFVRWPKAELMHWMSEAQIAIARSPGAYTRTAVIPLVKGTRQTLPDDGWTLISVIRNVDEEGRPNRAVRVTTRALMDSFNPLWHAADERPFVEMYIYDERTPREFFVSPPSDGTGFLEIVYGAVPAQLLSEDQNLVLPVLYDSAILDYVLYRANSKESDYAAGVQNAQQYFSSFNTGLGTTLQAREAATPNAALEPDTPQNANGGTE